MRSNLIHSHCLIVGLIGHRVTHLAIILCHNQSLNCNLYNLVGVRFLRNKALSYISWSQDDPIRCHDLTRRFLSQLSLNCNLHNTILMSELWLALKVKVCLLWNRGVRPEPAFWLETLSLRERVSKWPLFTFYLRPKYWITRRSNPNKNPRLWSTNKSRYSAYD